MKTSGIRELKNRLSAYVREVENGKTVLITDRGRVVAEMRPPGEAERAATPSDLRYRRLVDAGVIRPAAQARSLRLAELPEHGLAHGKAQDLLDEERGG